MNNFWSENVQGVRTLYLSRKLRFHDRFFGQYKRIFNLDENADIRILEIGCGPGALAESLHRWFPKAEITAIDRDSRFISQRNTSMGYRSFSDDDSSRKNNISSIFQLYFCEPHLDIILETAMSQHSMPSLRCTLRCQRFV